jgi:hypothetical protein
MFLEAWSTALLHAGALAPLTGILVGYSNTLSEIVCLAGCAAVVILGLCFPLWEDG